VLAALFLIATLATLAMPGSANFVGEFYILLGVFNSKMAFAFVASLGVVLASVYALRMYIRSMHNRTGPAVTSFEMSVRDGVVLVPLILAVVAFALYPQGALHHSERAVKAATAPVTQAGSPAARAEVAP
jgi:NADH-quinone oxidoreductase subunit M